MSHNTLVPAELLQSFVCSLFVQAGMNPSDAESVAQALVWAELRGIDTHGLSRVGFYVNFMQKGVIKTQPHFKVMQDTAAVQVLDADSSAGAVAIQRACEEAMGKARSVGLGLVMVRATTHTGALGYFTQRIARQGMLGVAFAASLPLMAYHGASAAGVSTAPLSIAVPAPNGEPMILDMASGAVSMGQLKQAKIFNTPLAAGLALDAQGQPTTDPQQATIPMPMSGPKGSGLALMFEMMASLVVMNPIIADYLSDQAGGKRHRQNAWVLALDIARFCPLDQFVQEVERTVNTLKALPSATDGGLILMPGERGQACHAQRLQEGVPLSAPLIKELTALSQTHAVPVPW
jgi:LDH2 family malate/lactate/ureidoglycolate dehydrogenase